VYIYNSGINSDDLLYDFNLLPGDTLASDYSYNPIIINVSDTILLTGDTMKVFYLDNGEYYIESLGGSKGFRFPMVPLAQGCSDPKCIIDNEEHLWGNDCYPIISGLNSNDFNFVVGLHPNPATEFIEIQLEGNSNGVVSIHDLTGRKIVTHTLYKSREIFDISFMTAGTYIYKLINQDKQTVTGKFIKIQ
jgi:hypothetical protein